tara:strand:- start:2675 stop:3103 length:429 start_codon:yes stop_codon:yes gene_type:complete
VAVIDWHSRQVLSWRLSNTWIRRFASTRLKRLWSAMAHQAHLNTDQRSQFTSEVFTGVLKAHDIHISMDGKDRVLDNIFVERLWRSVKYEGVYLKQYQTMQAAREGLSTYFEFYNHERPHQSLNDKTPAEAHGTNVQWPQAA